MKILLFANTEWYLYNFRRSLAAALRDAGHEVLLVSPPGPYGARLQALGFRWLPAPMVRRSLNPLREMAFLVWLSRLLRREQVDLVHGFTIKCAVYGGLAARLAGVPARVHAVAGMGYVFTNHDPKARLLRPVVRRLMRAALGGPHARLILQNPDDVAFFQQARLVPGASIRLIQGSGVDCGRFTPAKQPPPEPGAPVPRLRALLPARLLWDKGVAEYVHAARQSLDGGRRIDFLLAGDPDPGNPAAVPEATLREWVASGWIHWLGHVEDMAALYRSVDVVVLPSYYGEGLPRSLIEAAACGLPLITTDAPGCREAVDNGINGLLVPVKDPSALARAIARLHDDPALRRRLGHAARKKAVALFDERIVIQRTMAVYQELLGPAWLGPAVPPADGSPATSQPNRGPKPNPPGT